MLFTDGAAVQVDGVVEAATERVVAVVVEVVPALLADAEHRTGFACSGKRELELDHAAPSPV